MLYLKVLDLLISPGSCFSIYGRYNTFSQTSTDEINNNTSTCYQPPQAHSVNTGLEKLPPRHNLLFFVIANRNSSGKYQTVEENGKLSRLKRQSVHKTVHFNLMKLMSCRIKCGQTEEMWMLKKNTVHAYGCVHLYTCVCMRVCACVQMCV